MLLKLSRTGKNEGKNNYMIFFFTEVRYVYEVEVERRGNGADGNPPKEVCMVGWTPQLQNTFSLMPKGYLTPPEP